MDKTDEKDNVIKRLIKKIRETFSKKEEPIKKLPQARSYDQGVNVVVMQKKNFENLKVNVDLMNKRTKFENGFISIDDLSDEEMLDLIQIYNEEIIEMRKEIAAEKLRIERLKAERNKKGQNE